MKRAGKKEMIKYYDKLYSSKKSFREVWEGKLSVDYKIPKYGGEFLSALKGKKNVSVLEIGAGDGVISKFITKNVKCRRYVATEPSIVGVKKLRKLGFEAKQMFAEELKFPDNSFDVVCCFDVMHHAENPRKMAQEMLRVSRDSVFLIEANGACVIRKLLEKTEKYKLAGENSYTPGTYKGFFIGAADVKIKPFMFLFPNTSEKFAFAATRLSNSLEKVPIVKWQGSSVVINVRK